MEEKCHVFFLRQDNRITAEGLVFLEKAKEGGVEFSKAPTHG